MLGMVVRLLTARERMAVVGSAGAVRTVTVPCYGKAPIGTRLAGPAAASTAPDPWSTDQTQGTEGQS